MDPSAFDYVAGGSWDEISLAENEAAWRRRRLRPRVLVDVSRVDASTTMLGESTAMPLAIAPMAAQGLAHPDAEIAVGAGGGGRRGPVHPLDDVDPLDGGGRRGRARRHSLVPALHAGRPGPHPRPRRAGRGGRLSGDHRHRGPARCWATATATDGRAFDLRPHGNLRGGWPTMRGGVHVDGRARWRRPEPVCRGTTWPRSAAGRRSRS